MASVTWTVQIYFWAFTPIHCRFNPWVSPNRSNSCWVFQPRSDNSNRFLTCVLSHDSLDMERSMVQMLSWTLGIYSPDLFATHKDIKVTGVRHLTSYFLLPNLMVMNDHILPDGISSIDHHLSRLRHITFHILPLI
jgi:hypothetical protein